jgi:hypothetical protein
VPPGVAGELHVGGAGVARGYLNRPELTAERFVTDPFSDDPTARLYRTGDLGRFRLDGDIEYLGRIDQQVKIRGFRIEPGEIEAVMCALPAVRDAIVLSHGRNEHMRLVGYVIPNENDPGMVAALRRELQARLPNHMVPAHLIPVDAFPLTVNGKLDRAALPRPEDGRPSVDTPYAAPERALERQIAGAFKEVLGVQQVGLNDNFFDLGANSLLLVLVHRKLKDTLGRDLSVVSLFQYPNAAALAAHLGSLSSGDTHSITEQAEDRGIQRRAARDRRRALLR